MKNNENNLQMEATQKLEGSKQEGDLRPDPNGARSLKNISSMRDISVY